MEARLFVYMADATDSQKPSRKPLSRAEAARHASLVRWGKEQPATDKEQPRTAEDRLTLTDKPKPGATGELAQGVAGLAKDATAAEKPKAGGGGGGGGKKPEEEEKPDKDALRAAEQAENRAKVQEALERSGNASLNADAFGQLAAFADGGDADGEYLGALADATGLVERDRSGGYRLTTEGRAYVRAASSGDVRSAGDAMSRAMDRLQDKAERTAAQAEAAAEQERRWAEEDAENERNTRNRDAERAVRDDTARSRRRRRGTKMLEIKHGKHDQSSHGRRTARRRAYAGAYTQARAGGASPAEARALAKQAGLARQGERDARLQRMKARANAPKDANAAMTPAQAERAAQTAYATQKRDALEAEMRATTDPQRLRELGQRRNEMDSIVQANQRADRLANMADDQKQQRLAAIQSDRAEARQFADQAQARMNELQAQRDKTKSVRKQKELDEEIATQRSRRDSALRTIDDHDGEIAALSEPAIGGANRQRYDKPLSGTSAGVTPNLPSNAWEPGEAHARITRAGRGTYGFENADGRQAVIVGNVARGRHTITVNGRTVQSSNRELRSHLDRMKERGYENRFGLESDAGTRVFTKSTEEPPMGLQTIALDLEKIANDLAANADAEIKAGARNSAADQALIQQIFECANDLEEIAIALGADPGDDDDGEEEEEGGEVELLEGKSAAEMVFGSAIKALDGDRVGGFAVLFGDADNHDLSAQRDYFTKSTNFWLDRFGWPRPMTYHHGMDEDTRDDPIVGTWTKAIVKDEGVWMEGQLDRAHRYHGAVKELIRRGFLKLSSDSAPQWVLRERQPNGANEVKRWPLLTASPTVSPAEPRMAGLSLKALSAELRADAIDSNPQAQDDDGERHDSAKADDERARRLLVELDLLTLETTV